MLQRIHHAVIPPPIAAVSPLRRHIQHRVVGRAAGHADVVGCPVVAVAAVVLADGGCGVVAVVAEVQEEAIGAVGAGVLLGFPYACDGISLTEAAGRERLAVDEIDLGDVAVEIVRSRIAASANGVNNCAIEVEVCVLRWVSGDSKRCLLHPVDVHFYAVACSCLSGVKSHNNVIPRRRITEHCSCGDFVSAATCVSKMQRIAIARCIAKKANDLSGSCVAQDGRGRTKRSSFRPCRQSKDAP